MNANGARTAAMNDFLRGAGWGAAELRALPADASTRRYIRLVMNGRTAMLMDQPQAAEAPTAGENASAAERKALGYNAVARLAGADCARFVAAAKYLREAGLAAPEVEAGDIKNGFLILEDLGDDLYADVLAADADAPTLYGAAIDALAALHDSAAPSHLAPDKPLYPYDDVALLAETDLLTEWFLPEALQRPLRDDERDEHRALWVSALSALDNPARVFVHRDYHAQNLLWLPQRERLARVGMVDFQDAVAGSPAYDIISLLEDARRDVDPALAAMMTDRYLMLRGPGVDEESFRMEAALLAAQRNAKIIGIFARLNARDGKPRYLSYLPRVWRYMTHDLQHPSLAKLKAWYDRVIPPERRKINAHQGDSL